MSYEGRPAREFLETDLVQRQLKLAARVHATEAGESFESMTAAMLRHYHSLTFDSPLEVAFFVWWHALEPGYRWMKEAVFLELQREVEVNGERFRLDFVVEASGEWAARLTEAHLEWPLIAVEVDGHEFHERTPEQVATRDRRDRLLQQGHWKVFHFSYREFTNNPEECAREVWEYAALIYQDLFRAIHPGAFQRA